MYTRDPSRDSRPAYNSIRDRETARKAIEADDLIEITGYGRYLVSLKPPADLESDQAESIPFSERIKAYTKVGMVTLKARQFNNAPLAPDVGYGLLSAFQGKGYATEAAAALLRWFEEEKGQTEFFGFCNPDNEGSKGVLRRMGFEERGVRNIRGLYSDEGFITGMVFSRGLTKDLEAYNLN